MFLNFKRAVPVAASCMLLTLASLVHGQIRSATISGAVMDSTGAAVPGAEVSITNQDTNITAKLKASDSGQFGMTLNLTVDAVNLLNSVQYSGAHAGGLGATNLVDNPAKGLKVGMGANDAFGTIGLGTFDPRQVTGRLLLRF